MGPVPKISVLFLIAGTAFAGAMAAPAAASRLARPGADADAHGCRASAGYRWCARTNRCERPWELARKNGFQLAAPSFGRFCRQAGRNR